MSKSLSLNLKRTHYFIKMFSRSLSILILGIALFCSGNMSAQGLINGNLLVCSNSSGVYAVQGHRLYDVNWIVTGGFINSGQGTSAITVDWHYVNSGLITFSAKDSSTSNTLYDTLNVSIDTSCVWPGDANHDHKVSYTDLLAIGEAFGKSHHPCMDTSTEWVGQPRCRWRDTIGLGIEMKHADCNGDGIIDLNDTAAIIRNYSKTGMYKNSNVWLCPPPQVGDPPLRIWSGLSNDTIYPGHYLYTSVYFGAPDFTVNAVYGIAFSFNYDPEIFDGNMTQVDLSQQWITASCKDSIVFYKNFPDVGRIDFAFCRTDHNYNTGSGELVTLKMHIKDKFPVSKSMSRFTIGEFQFISLDGALSGVVRTNDSAVVAGNVGIENAVNIDNNVSVYPDPAKDLIQINCTSGISNLILYNELGSSLWQQKYSGNPTQEKVVLPASLHGIYILQISDRQGFTSRKKVMVQ